MTLALLSHPCGKVAPKGQFTPVPDFDDVPHRMKLSMPSSSTVWGKGQRNKWLAVWCTCMAQTRQQARDPKCKVDWKFWGWDYLAVIPITTPAGPIFRKHVQEYDADRQQRAQEARKGDLRALQAV